MTNIDGNDISTWGIETAKGGFYSSLMQFPDIKDRISKSWAEKNGIQILLTDGKLKSRTFTLSFYSDTYQQYYDFIEYMIAHPTFEIYDDLLGHSIILEYQSCSDYHRYSSFNTFGVNVRENNPQLRYI